MKNKTDFSSLVYSPGRKNHNTIKREYLIWRQRQKPPIHLRCDIETCMFHTEDLVWNGKKLKLVLDHINGVSGDNRPNNLRFICPNCNSQLMTHGGGNKGKVEQSKGGFSNKDSEGKKHYTMPVETGKFNLIGGDVKLSKH